MKLSVFFVKTILLLCDIALMNVNCYLNIRRESCIGTHFLSKPDQIGILSFNVI